MMHYSALMKPVIVIKTATQTKIMMMMKPAMVMETTLLMKTLLCMYATGLLSSTVANVLSCNH